ncbi:hypothetical protein [Niastella sp. OAS944]|uniref:hypothetical protein n=1 Tax=Niastella sp. OAS944 TaxID=2664089 RepID=UPI003470520A|nr:hypothetical protein [Chitinophagaceae bacterium OAS944]
MFKVIIVVILETTLFQIASFAQTNNSVGASSPTERLNNAIKALADSNHCSNASARQYLYNDGFRNLWMGFRDSTDFHIANEKANGNIHLRSNSGRVYIESSYDNNNIGGTLMLTHPGKTNVGQNKDWAIYNMKDQYGNGLQFWGYGSGNAGKVLTLGDNGNVSIGNIIPDSVYKLQIAGIVKAAEYKANVTTISWPDYVFDPVYRLPSLADVESYLKQNHHLSEVPSAETVKKDGINLGENQAVLLKKIEELTLYVIEQNKKLEEQNKKLALLEEKIIELTNKNK